MSNYRYITNQYYGSRYPQSFTFKSVIYLNKGEQAYYKPLDIRGGDKYPNYYKDCKSVDNNDHSCTWLEIKKTGDPIA